MISELDASTYQTLHRSVVGRSDDALLSALVAVGVERGLGRALALRGEAFVPARLDGRSGGIHYLVTWPGGAQSFHMIVADGRCTTGIGPPSTARITLEVSAPNLLRMCAGVLAPQLAYFQGTLKVTGDMLFAQALANAFRKP